MRSVPGDQAEIKVDFLKRGFTHGDQQQIYLDENWYPEILWDESLSQDSYNVSVKYPPGYQIAVSGIESSEKNRFTASQARHFWIYLGKDQNLKNITTSGVKLSVIYPKDGEDVAEMAFATLQKAIPFFVEKYGFFPYSYFTVIPGDRRGPWGGYNFGQGMAVIHGMNHFAKKSETFWKWISVHELCHHYWGEYVLDGDDPSWLWIGLGIYADQSYLKSVNDPFTVYRNFQEQYYYQGVLKHRNTTLVITPEMHNQLSDEYDWNNTTKHGKGYTVIKALESVIGQENMNQLMLRLLHEFGWKTLNSMEFQKIAEEVSGQSLNWFFDQWVRSNRYLSVEKVDSSCTLRNGLYFTNLTLQHVGNLIMPVPVELCFEDESKVLLSTDRGVKRPVLSYTSQSPLTRIKIDPDQQLPLFEDAYQQAEEDLTDMINELPYSDVGEDAIEPYRLALKLNTSNTDHWYSLGLRLFDGGLLDQASDCFTRSYDLSLQKQDTSGMVGGLCWLGIIADEKDQRPAAIEFYKKANDLDYDTFMMYSQYGLTIDKDWIRARLHTPYNGIITDYETKN